MYENRPQRRRTLEVHAGGEFSRGEYVLAGAPMANMSVAENYAEAGQTDDPAMRRSYLENVQINAAIVAQFNDFNSPATP